MNNPLYVETLRCDAYFSIQDTNTLKMLRSNYEYWVLAGPDEYKDQWKATLDYCNEYLKKLGIR